MWDDGLPSFILGKMDVQTSCSSFEAELKMVDFDLVFAVIEGVVTKIGGNEVVCNGVCHFLI